MRSSARFGASTATRSAPRTSGRTSSSTCLHAFRRRSSQTSSPTSSAFGQPSTGTIFSVSYYTLVEQAPVITALYRAPAFVDLLASVTGRPLQPCPASDPHACALYFYTEPGDHIGFHYDTSFFGF